ncbi:amphiphysin-like isoform X3 [Lethenteron reissneri]|uniref:amphiphysin-like isoform X3 n=1 Tax=Lethenteron reissneri TaxID=7753 RepID=UPI002AB5E616|nr:amphiphysin-like isoform X3 [Lethenteron reissneri]
MADPGKTSTGIFAKNAKKRISRAQEKVLQKLGKADETKDVQFEEQVQNFNKQYNEGSRLQKELRGYLTAVKAMHESSKKMNETLQDIYEPDWHGKEDVQDISQNSDELWGDFHEKLVDNSLLTLDTYLGQFPDIKSRISKRGRKLVDYDSARHHLESLQGTKKKEDVKVAKAEEDYLKAQKVFEEINNDLQEELPVILNSRVGFYVNTFKSIAGLEENFHKEIGQLNHELLDVMVKLEDQHSNKAFSIHGAPRDSRPLKTRELPPSIVEPPAGTSPTSDDATPSPTHAPTPHKSPMQGRKGPPVPPPPKLTPSKEMTQEAIVNLFDDNFMPNAATASTPLEVPLSKRADTGRLLDLDFDPVKQEPTSPSVFPPQKNQSLDGASKHCPSKMPIMEVVASTPTPVELTPDDASFGCMANVSAECPPIANVSTPAQSYEFPPGFLYKVQVQHDYTPVDMDELCLGSGEVVLVLPFESPEQQDSGWLAGIKEADWIAHKVLEGHKGVFPDNFTLRIE